MLCYWSWGVISGPCKKPTPVCKGIQPQLNLLWCSPQTHNGYAAPVFKRAVFFPEGKQWGKRISLFCGMLCSALTVKLASPDFLVSSLRNTHAEHNLKCTCDHSHTHVHTRGRLLPKHVYFVPPHLQASCDFCHKVQPFCPKQLQHVAGPYTNYLLCVLVEICVIEINLYRRVKTPAPDRFIGDQTKVCDVCDRGGTVENWWLGCVESLSLSLIDTHTGKYPYKEFTSIHGGQPNPNLNPDEPWPI